MRFFLLLTCFISSLFSLDYKVIEDTSNLKINTPSLQNRKTIKIKLSNELEALIISDPSIDESAASLVVNCGSWNDPKEYPGMAHFTEHMLFQGTKAFPSSSDFIHFITDNKGKYNAFTAFDRTVYMFSVNNGSFLPALERFSAFFSSPLFDPSSIKSELFAIDQEHAKNIENDNWRHFQVWKENSNANHPNHNFSTGNSETLSKIPRDALLDWHKRHYSANRMKLVVYSNLKLKESVEKVSSLFKNTLVNKMEDRPIVEDLSSADQKGCFFYIKPIKNLQQLTLRWELPKIYAKDRSRSANLIAYALSAGQKNSLLENLKSENLAEDLETDATTIGKQNIIFDISIDLTDKGLQNIPLVLEKCFQTLSLLKKEKVASYFFQETQTMRKVNYENQSHQDAFSYVKKVSSELPDENLSSYPRETLLASEYSLKTIAAILEELSPDSCSYYVLADPSKTKIQPTKKEKWSGVEYTPIKMDAKMIKSLSSLPLSKEIKIAPPNPFIPSSLSLLKREPSGPIKVIENKNGQVFYFSDPFKTPEINWIFHIKTPLPDGKAKSCAMLDLYLKILSEKLSPLTLQFSLAGITTHIEYSEDELLLQITGYSEKASSALLEILKNMLSLSPSKEQFESSISSLRKNYENKKYNLALFQANEQFDSLIHENTPTNAEKESEFSSITYNDFLAFCSTIFKKTYVEAMLGGNLTIKDSEALWLDLQGTFASLPYDKPKEPKILSLPEGPYQIQKNSSVLGCGILLSIDESPFSFKRRAAQGLLAQALEEPFFSELRTKQKTAYIVSSSDLEINKHLFQIFALQSSSHTSLELLYRFEIFIEQYLQEIQSNIDKKRFENIKESLLINLKKPPKNLQEMAIIFDKLAFHYKDFDYKQKRIKALTDLTYEEFLQYSTEFLSRCNKKRMAILIDGKIPEKTSIKYLDATSKELCEKGNYTCEAQIE